MEDGFGMEEIKNEDRKHELDNLLEVYIEKKKILDEVIELEKKYTMKNEG